MAEIHLLNDIAEARCECALTDGHTASEFVDDVTCARCIRMHLDEQIIRMESEHQEQIKELQDQFQILLKAVVGASMSNNVQWCGVEQDMDSMGDDGVNLWKSASVYLNGSSYKLSPEKLYISESYGSFDVGPKGETYIKLEEPVEEPPSLYDHLLK